MLRRIGLGSYGEVWLARNAVGTLRAVKIVHRQTFERAGHFEREFNGLQKFEPISRSHDGLVDILQIGRNDAAGYFYYVMELADGEPIQNEKCKMQNEVTAASGASDRPQSILNFEFHILNYRSHTLRAAQHQPGGLPAADCVRIGLALASALEHLHSCGLVHRDIKPTNIIFVNGVPKLADIGLVAHIDDARSLVGTAGYIPPEGPGTPQADLYSLGKVLYEISLGKDRQEFPQLPPDLQSHPDHAALLELNEITLKACETDPRRRYQSAQQMHDDLAFLQRGQSVRRKRAAQRRMVFVRRIGLVVAAIVLLVSGGWFAIDRLGQTPGPVPKGHLPKSWKPSPEAMKLYDEGWAHLMKQTKDGTARSIDCFTRATDLEPNYALAYCGLSDAYGSQSEAVVAPIQSLSAARQHARRAVEIDDQLPDGHVYLGLALMWRYEFAGAEVEFKRAVALGPSNGWAHTCYATLLRCLGRTEHARKLQKRAFELEPSERIRLRDWYYQLWSERKFFEAVQQGEKLSQVASNWAMTPWLRGRAYGGCDRLEEAARELTRPKRSGNCTSRGRVNAAH